MVRRHHLDRLREREPFGAIRLHEPCHELGTTTTWLCTAKVVSPVWIDEHGTERANQWVQAWLDSDHVLRVRYKS